MQLKRTFDFLHYQNEKFPLKKCINYKKNGEWQSLSTTRLIEITNQLSFGLLKRGIKKGDKVALISENRPEWLFVDLAVQQIGAVLVPLYPNIRSQDYKYIFEQTNVKMIFVSDEEIYSKVSEALPDIDKSNVYMFDKNDICQSWKGLRLNYAENHLGILEKHRGAISENDLFTIIYTSGTTGFPKGVMLTHKNIVFNVLACEDYTKVEKGNFNAFSFLPLNHVFERSGVYTYLFLGGSIYFGSSMEKLGEEIKETQPHVFNSVPRVLEKVYDKILSKASTLGSLKKGVFNWAVNLGLKYEPGKLNGGIYGKQLALADKLVFSKWREALGGNLIQINCGAAALQPRLIRVFWAAKINVLEGYGLTETSPIIAVNSLEEPVTGTVGRPLKGVEVKISSDGEILVKGPNVMLGYYGDPQLTDDVMKDDWFHTGDIGQINSNYLKITDRKKSMFKTSNGFYIAPQTSENKLRESPYIEHALVIGEDKKFASALIVPNFGKLLEFASKKFILMSGNRELIESEEVQKLFQKEFETINKNLSQWEKIRQFKLVDEPWGIESGELTATLKMKRKDIISKFSAEIKDIYKDDGSDLFKDVKEEKALEKEMEQLLD